MIKVTQDFHCVQEIERRADTQDIHDAQEIERRADTQDFHGAQEIERRAEQRTDGLQLSQVLTV